MLDWSVFCIKLYKKSLLLRTQLVYNDGWSVRNMHISDFRNVMQDAGLVKKLLLFYVILRPVYTMWKTLTNYEHSSYREKVVIVS